MSATDPAFINAYYQDASEPTPPAPHISLSLHPLAGCPELQAAAAELDSEPRDEEDPYAPEPWELEASQGARSLAEIQQTEPRREVAVGQPGEVTQFVPHPHIPFGPAASTGGPARERTELKLGGELSNDPAERRPLSSFSSTEPVATDFSPALEVDGFRWSVRSQELLAATGDAWQAAAENIWLARDTQDMRVIAVASCWRGEGRTTALLCLAKVLAEYARKTSQRGPALVDADFCEPSLASELGLELDTGWEDTISGEVPLAEAVVASKNDGVMLLPLRSRIEKPIALCENVLAPVSLRVLRENASIVLIDLGPVLDEESAASSQALIKECGVDAAILIRDCSSTTDDDVATAKEYLATDGAPVIGMIENFCAGSERTKSSRADLQASPEVEQAANR